MRFVDADFRLRDAEKTLQDRNNELGETQEKWERETNAKPPPKPNDEGMLALLTFDDTLRPLTNASAVEETDQKVKTEPKQAPVDEESVAGPRFVRDDKPEFVEGRLSKSLKLNGKTPIDLGQLGVFERSNAFSYRALVNLPF